MHKRIGDLKAGDKVIGATGREYEVTENETIPNGYRKVRFTADDFDDEFKMILHANKKVRVKDE